ncbi:MAG: aldo/keto reductase [Thiotrichales bacterium]|nr:MAG: aldo/keto reductase [Thiotrichales bacterium]
MIEKRQLGNKGPEVGCLGYGAMALEGYYGAVDEADAIATIQHALDLGMDFIDSADAYGEGHNELLIAKAIKARRDDAFICTKFGIVYDANDAGTDMETGWGVSLRINGAPGYVKKSLQLSRSRLGVDVIDLWYAHYPDPSIPIEDTVGAMAECVQAGDVRYLGLCNVSAEEVRRANEVHPIAAVQFEYSLWRREVETTLLPTLRELGIALIPWSPLGGGFLTGEVKQLAADDFRHNNPRYAGANLDINRDRFAPLMQLAKDFRITPAQLALSWLLHQGEDIIPVPGTRKAERLDENAASANVQLDAETLEQIDRIAPAGLAEGATLV